MYASIAKVRHGEQELLRSQSPSYSEPYISPKLRNKRLYTRLSIIMLRYRSEHHSPKSMSCDCATPTATRTALSCDPTSIPFHSCRNCERAQTRARSSLARTGYIARTHSVSAERVTLGGLSCVLNRKVFEQVGKVYIPASGTFH
jgi:hypothetical protein